jgi:hypothetical protein
MVSAGAMDAPVQPKRAERRSDVVLRQRDERRKRYERNRRDWMLTKIGAAVVLLIFVGAAGFGIYQWAQDRGLNRVPDGVQSYTYSGGQHTQEPGQVVQYAEVPPVGGMHDPTWQNCGYYPAPIRTESGVHSMEHGAVWITYRQDLPQDQIDKLKDLAESTTYILVSPFPDLDSPIVASSWNKQLKLDSADDERLDQFIRVFRQGSETPERGAACTGGTSATVA